MHERENSGHSTSTRQARRLAAGLAAAALLAGGAGLTGAGTAAAAPAKFADDFNGDGYHDLVVAAPSATVGGKRAAGYVAVLYGGPNGISAARKTVLSQASTGVPGSPETGDAFGGSVASDDFDGDGYADLAVGVPGEDIGTVTDSGGGAILWGSKSGLSGADSQGVQEATPLADNEFGKGLAAGKFGNAGAVEFVVLANNGLTEYGVQPAARTLAAHKNAKSRTLAADGIIPTSLTAGDFLPGTPGDDLMVNGIRTGSRDGAGWGQLWQGGFPDGIRPTDRTIDGGPVGAAGDLNKDGITDLATAEPAPPGEAATGGKIKVWYGTPTGPSGDPEVWTQNSAGVAGNSESGDYWGSDLSIGDANGDGYADLAIGAEGENIGSIADAGAVWLLRGSAGGVTATGSQDYNQDTTDVPGVPEKLDRFGGALRLIDADGNGQAGLVAAAPGENTFDGFAWVFSGTASGLTAKNSWTFGGSSLGAPAADAQFGSVLGEE
ncbi:esterase [Streptomyces boninensis]|uniref:esterase n=1 Tax=Streptomyces boninensis TaxID=2039455 RepID=UPI003B218A5C